MDCINKFPAPLRLLRTLLLSWLAIAALCNGTSASEARRLALVIGNNAYQKVEPLNNARNDARLMAATLKRAGFEVTQANDLGRDDMWRTIDTFKGRINKGDEIVFFFAGHGVQINSNQLLLPIDISAVNDAQVQRDAVSLVDVQDALKDARFALMVIDACRDNPFPKTGLRAIGGGSRGLLPPEPVTGQVIVMSAGRNQRALDGVPGESQPNGLFTWELTRAMQTPGLEIRTALEQVKDRVDDKAKSVGHEQRPGMVSDLRGNFYFFGPLTVQVQAGQSGISSTNPESETWSVAERVDSVEGYQVYLDAYPKGSHVAAAKIAMGALKKVASQHSQVEQSAWEAAKSVGTQVAYASYLRNYPTGNFAGLAQVAQQTLHREAQESQRKQREAEENVSREMPPGKVFKDCADCPDMVVLPAGSFEMGENGKTHSVTLKSFSMGRTEVTQAQWLAVMGANPSGFIHCGSDCPVEKVNWDDAQDFIEKLNAKTGQNYRLPSESEWEYACKAGKRQEYCGSPNLGFVGWYGAYSAPVGNSGETTNRVASKQANAWGMHDMSGNVWEWTQDCWNETYTGAPADGSAWTSGTCEQRVLRGGSWLDNPSYTRAPNRNYYDATDRVNYVGFRLARMLQ
jgi:formylglycine-generating enzyme required for sulfatase activity